MIYSNVKYNMTQNIFVESFQNNGCALNETDTFDDFIVAAYNAPTKEAEENSAEIAKGKTR